MKRYITPLLFLLNFCLMPSLFSQKITGKITGELGQPLSFSSVLIKGTTKGVSANADGLYSIEVAPGSYTLVAQHVGYFPSEIAVTLNDNSTVTINFNLPLQQYNLSDVIVTSGGEDPAYGIIRNAIQKRPQYEHEVKQLQCDVYIKGRLQLQAYPKRFFGQKVALPGLDTMQNQTLFLSETLARWSVQEPDKQKVEVLSTRVSGNSSGYGLSYPQIISFYHNTIKIGSNLNPRGFVSPIADNAMLFYNYKLDGTFTDGNLRINHIRVIPKRKFEPAFAGYINIIDSSWRIYSIDLSVQKDQQMQYLDLLKIEQLYMPVDTIWLVKQQVIYPSFNLFGFEGYGNFVQVYSNFNLQPNFATNFFNNILISYPDSSTKKPKAYWDTIRPLPLEPSEIADYKRKDSLEVIRHRRHYLDSVDRIRNTPKLIPLVLLGQTFIDTKKNTEYFFDAFINTVSYNTVEGANIIFSPNITKRWQSNRRVLFVSPTLRYGFTNRHFNPHLAGSYTFGKQYQTSLYLSGGKRVFQVNNNQPITAYSNALSTLLYRENFMKIYEAPFARLGYAKELKYGITASVYGEYQDRHPLENTTDFSIFKAHGRQFTPNYPQEIVSSDFPRHKATTLSFAVKWQPGSQYIEFPNRIINIGSSYPTFTATFTQGLHKTFGSDVNYNKWTLNVTDSVNLNLAGKLAYNVTLGGFINKQNLFTPDYQHYYGNKSFLVTDYLNTFLLSGFYNLSNTSSFFTEVHAEYHLNGLITNKIPLMRKWNWFFVVGGNGLVFNNRQYAEGYLSIENIFKVFRLDFVQSYNPQGGNTSGIRLSALGLLTNSKED